MASANLESGGGVARIFYDEDEVRNLFGMIGSSLHKLKRLLTTGRERAELSLRVWADHFNFQQNIIALFTQPPSGTVGGGCVYVLQLFFFCFFPSTKTMRQPFSGTAERIFMKLLPNDRGENVV